MPKLKVDVSDLKNEIDLIKELRALLRKTPRESIEDVRRQLINPASQQQLYTSTF
jgi:hypothetical protein